MNDPATHRCKVCGALWWKGYVHPVGMSWSLRSPTCGKCCDNVAMGDQIEPLPAPASVEAGPSSGLRPSAPEALMPCPFCGGEPHLEHPQRGVSIVYCGGHVIGCISPTTGWCEDEFETAVVRWNRRLTPPQADAKAIPSSASPPPPPEGVNARLLDALTKCHLALADLGSRIQCTAGGFWQVRHPHSEMQAVIAAVDEAMLLYHAVTRASGEAMAATSDNPVVPIEGAKPEERQV